MIDRHYKIAPEPLSEEARRNKAVDFTKEALEVDLRNILRAFYGQMKELRKSGQPDFNKGLDGICTYDEAIEKILKRTSVLELYGACNEAFKWMDRLPKVVQEKQFEIWLKLKVALAKAEVK